MFRKINIHYEKYNGKLYFERVNVNIFFKSICLLRKMNTDLEKFKSNIKQFCFCSEQFHIEIQDISWFLNFLDKPKHFEYN